MAKTYIDKNGYKRYKDSNILVHRHVAERTIGRKLKSGEVVHHKNRKKQDNSRKNLWVLKTKKKHSNNQKKEQKKTGRW